MNSPLDTGLFRGIRRAWRLIGREERRRLFLIAAYGVLIAALDTVALVLVFGVINLLNDEPVLGVADELSQFLHVAGEDRYHAALVLFAITAALFVLRSVLSVVGLWLIAGATNAAQADVISRLLVGHARAPQLMRLERNAAETLRTVLISVDQVVGGVVSASVSLVANVAVAVAVAIGLFLASPLVALAVTAYFAAVAAAWGFFVRGSLSRRGARVQQLQQERYRLVLQALAAAKELQLRGRALFYAESAVERTRGINAAWRGASVANGSLRYVLETSLILGAVLVVAAAGLTGGQRAVLPAVGLVLAGAFRLLPALNQILFLTNQVQYNKPAIQLLETELRTFGAFGDRAKSLGPDAEVPLRFGSELRLQDVTFRYPARPRPVLRRVGFVVRRGESFGILGPTGSGKSTLLDIILGVLEPVEGRVTIDGAPLADCRERWQRSIGYVPQEVYLVDETLRANIALGWSGDDIDHEAVGEAVRLTRLQDIVARLPEGLETVVGERGVRLSGGQRQLVGLARALYTRPSVLVLDEATSNLDPGTEQRIVDTLGELPGGVTTIVVTHRISSVRRCDRVLYLEHGVVRAVGTLQELREAIPALTEAPAGDVGRLA